MFIQQKKSVIELFTTIIIFFNFFFSLKDAFPLGEIILGRPKEGFSVDETAPPELGGGENAFVLNTPTRTFPLLSETSEDKISWLAVLRSAIENPPFDFESPRTVDSYGSE